VASPLDWATERCRHYIEGIRAAYKSEPLPQAPPVSVK